MRRKGRRRTFDLTGPGRCYPLAFDDDAGVPSISLGDSSVSDISAPASCPPPVSGTPSAEHGRFRQEVRSSMQFMSPSSAAPGTVRTYEATLRAVFPELTAKLSSRALPLDAGSALYAFFAAVVLLGPKSPSAVTGQPALRWSYVRLVKEVAAFWHVVRGMRAVLDAERRPRLRAF